MIYLINKKYTGIDKTLLVFLLKDNKTQLRYLVFKYNDVFYYICISKNILLYTLKEYFWILVYGKQDLNLYLRLFRNLLISIFYKYILLLEVYGIGYKVFFKSLYIYFILSFSHLIKIKIPYNCNVYIKDNGKLLNISHSNKYILGNIYYILHSLRSLDIYKGKGIRSIYRQLKLKLGKVKSIKK